MISEPGNRTVWVQGLGAGEHRIKVFKRNESAHAGGRFFGFELRPGDKLLPAPRPRADQMVFIEDSLTLGYGNASIKRDCTDAEVSASTNSAKWLIKVIDRWRLKGPKQAGPRAGVQAGGGAGGAVGGEVQ